MFKIPFKIFKFKLSIATIVISILLILCQLMVGYALLLHSDTEQKTVIIPSGTSVKEISLILEQEGVIQYPKIFEILAKIYSLKKPLKGGEYIFTRSITPYQILLKLASGKSIIHKLVVKPGTTIYPVLSFIESEKRLLGSMDFEILEGQLMPDTYFYSYGDRKDRILRQMLTNMYSALDEALKLLDKDSPLKTKRDILILASIIEKEAGNEKEKPLIASVLVNRLKKNMRLQADPTTIYALTEGKFQLSRPLTLSDLKIESSYNTYHVFGLPLGAISCPSKSSIMAAAKPAKTTYLYFAANMAGGHNFASNLADHNINVQKLRELQKQPKLDNITTNNLE